MQDLVFEPIPDPLWWLGTKGLKKNGTRVLLSRSSFDRCPWAEERRGWARSEGQKARVRKQPQGFLGFIKADPISSHFSLN